MSNVLAVDAPVAPPVEEKSGNLKTRLVTAAALGGLGVSAYFAQKNGWIHGDWPPPMRSFKHPWIGYYSAWIGDKVFKRGKYSAAVISGEIANAGAKTAQGEINHPHGGAFYWLHDQHSFEANLDNASDFLICLGGTALYFAQNNYTPDIIRGTASRLYQRFSRSHPEPAHKED